MPLWFVQMRQPRRPTLITPAVVPKRHTLFEMIFWNNCAWLNMCRAVLNVEHFEGRWVWLSFNINFYKDGTPLPLQVCTSVCIIFAHTGAGVIRLNKPCKIEHCIILCIPSRKSSFQREFARIKKWKTLVIDEKKGDSKALMMRIWKAESEIQIIILKVHIWYTRAFQC